MDREEYERIHRLEGVHWWYVGMRGIADVFLAACASPGAWQILDAGCGTGGMLDHLQHYGQPIGLDLAPEALAFSQQRGHRITGGSVTELPFPGATFDLVTCFDVLYHLWVHDDTLALAEFHRVLRDGGYLLVRVPAYDWLRGAHDQTVQTRHRYTAQELRQKVSAAGFALEKVSYANTLLFPLILAKRLLETKRGQRQQSDLSLPPPALNRVLAFILSLEARPLRYVSLPWGLSVMCLARKGKRQKWE